MLVFHRKRKNDTFDRKTQRFRFRSFILGGPIGDDMMQKVMLAADVSAVVSVK
jgi:hypothetical protein